MIDRIAAVIAAVETDGRDKPVKDIHIISIRPEI